MKSRDGINFNGKEIPVNVTSNVKLVAGTSVDDIFK